MDKNKLIEEALDNIRTDRVTTESLLQKLQQEIQQNQIENAKAGFVAAKYVETLQRSNEQLVKVIHLIQKAEQQNGSVELSDNEKDNLFELIQGEVSERASGEE
tara:strand:+ start:722 stop:1033 length:312 start_codon:yes stop_codon:yes gene_type:complete